MNRIKTAVLAVALAASLSLTATPAAEAHSPCTGYCNTIENYSPVHFDIYDYSGDAYPAWPLWGTADAPGYHRTDGWSLYQRDVGGFWIGPGWCFQLWQSNDGYNYGYWGGARGPYKMVTDYWKFNRVNQFRC